MLPRPAVDSVPLDRCCSCWEAELEDPDVPGEVCDQPVIGQIVKVPITIPEIIALFFFIHFSPFK